MRHIITLLTAIGIATTLLAQSPDLIHYQALLRDNNGNPLINTATNLQITIREGADNGPAVYQETHSVTTTGQGLVNIAIGGGTVVSGNISTIAWHDDAHYLQVEVMDGGSYITLGTTQLVSVPYAKHATSAQTVTGTAGGDISGSYDAITVTGIQGRTIDNTAPTSGQILKWNGSAWSPAPDNAGTGGSGAWSVSGNNIYYNSGLVGVGENNPLAQLHVNAASGTIPFRVQSNNVTKLLLENGGLSVGGGLTTPPTNGLYVADKTGIGTASPAEMLHVMGSVVIEGNNQFLDIRNTSNNTLSGIRLLKGTGFRAGLFYYPDENIVNLTRDSRFYRLVLDRQNNVVIGDTVGDNNAALTVSSQLNNGRIKFGSFEYVEDGGANTMATYSIRPETDNIRDLGTPSFRWDDVYATNGVIQTSDARLKDNIIPVSYGLQEVLAMQPVQFGWKDAPYQEQKIGFLAQDLQKLVPEVVKSHDWVQDENGEMILRKNKWLGVNYSDLIPVLVKAIQEQQVQIEQQQAQINQLMKALDDR